MKRIGKIKNCKKKTSNTSKTSSGKNLQTASSTSMKTGERSRNNLVRWKKRLSILQQNNEINVNSKAGNQHISVGYFALSQMGFMTYNTIN